MSLLSPIEHALRAGQRAFLLVGSDELRCVDLLSRLGRELEAPVHTWSAASGIDHDERPLPLVELLLHLREHAEPGLWLVLDAAPHLHDPATLRHLREFAQHRRDDGPMLVLVDPTGHTGALDIGARVPELAVYSLPLPDRDELEGVVEAQCRLLRASHPELLETLDAHRSALMHACLGLEAMDLRNLLGRAVVAHGSTWPEIIGYIQHHKAELVDRAALLTPVTPVSIDTVGGLVHLKAWLHRRKLALDPRAQAHAVPSPRGLMLLGVQGCGKSWAARATADALSLPLVRLDPGRLFGGTVGASEANLRRLIGTVERLAPAVLWLDEIDKSLAGADGASSDAGTTSRVVGALLTWLQERTAPVFVVVTANRVDTLPPELLRRGRLDELFFVDLPTAEEREAILRVHLEHLPAQRLGAAPPMADPWPAFASVIRDADGVSGSEIESALIEARLQAFAQKRPLRASDLAEALAELIPLSVSRAEELEALRAWARTRARRA